MLNRKVQRQLRAERSRLRWRQQQHQSTRQRLTVFKSAQHIYAQIIDQHGHVLTQASTLEATLRHTPMKPMVAAAAVGNLVAQRALTQGIKSIYFDCAGFKYHGRIKMLAETAKVAGLDF
jgi:large subunit ribosomal protein L18